MTPEETLVIENACRRLVTEWAHIVDAQRYGQLTSVFTDNAVFARPSDPDTQLEGLRAILASYAARPATRVTRHLCTNILIDVHSATEASGTTYVLLYTADVAAPEVAGKGRKGAGQFLGAFADDFVRTAEGWRIARRLGSMTLHITS